MPTQMVVRMGTLMVCLGLMCWSGCANFLKPEMGAVARKEARIVLAGDIPAGTWETPDLHLAYTFAQQGESFTFTGDIRIDRSVSDSYPAVVKFSFYLSFLDDRGKVIETVDISPVVNTFGAIPNSLEVRLSRLRPPGSSAIVFHYYGVFRGPSHDSVGQWDIYHFPFD
jgi:hypothetical protein